MASRPRHSTPSTRLRSTDTRRADAADASIKRDTEANHRLVPEDPINAEVLRRPEAALPIGELIEHARRHGRRVRPQYLLPSLIFIERAPVANTTTTTRHVHVLHPLIVVRGPFERGCGLLDEERVVRVSSWMRLRLEKSIEVPETRFDPF